MDLNPTDAFGFLIKTLFDMYSFCVLARIIFQLVQADFYNPVCQFVVKATNPFLRPMHRVLPIKPVDFAAVILLLFVQVIKIGLLAALTGSMIGVENLPVLLAIAAIASIGLVLDFFVFAIFILVIASWIMPGGYHPVMALLQQTTEPLLSPVRRLLPSLGGLDLAPMVVLLSLYFLRILLGL